VVLVDASASVRRTRPDWVAWARGRLAREARAAAEAGERFAVVAFASEVARTFGPDAPAVFLERWAGRAGAPFDPGAGAGADDGSRLADALGLAEEVRRAARPARTRWVLLGDGRWTGRDPAPELAALVAGGAAFERIAPPPPARSDLALERLVLPPRVEPDAPLVARAELALEPGLDAPEGATLDVVVENDGETRELSFDLAPPAAGGAFEAPVDLGRARAGRTRVRARAHLGPRGDPVPENDAASAVTVAPGDLAVGVLADPAALEAARRFFAPSGSSGLPGLAFEFLPPHELALALETLDAVVSWDLPPSDLPEVPLEDFVRRGGGWLATSGFGLLTDWHPGSAERGAARLLPLVPEPRDEGPRDVVLLVDGSGSMAGAPFETVRVAAVDLIGAALVQDRVTLRFFTGGLREEHLLKESGAAGAREEAARELLGPRVPGGETMILRSLERFAAAREAARRPCLALLLTDGNEREATADPPARAAALLERLAAAGTRLVVIGVGDDPDERFLRLLVRPGDEVRRGEGLTDLRSVFRREIGAARWHEGDALGVLPAPAAPGSLVEGLRTGAPTALPPVRRFVADELRAGAELLWTSDEGEPIAAVRRVGAGRTAQLAFLPDPEWAPAWSGLRGAGEPAVLGPLLRWLARRPTSREPLGAAPRLAWEGDELVLRGVPPGTPARVPARLELADDGEAGAATGVAVGPDLELRFEASAAGADRSEERRLRPPPELATLFEAAGLGLVVRLGGPDAGARFLGLPPRPAAEFRPHGPQGDAETRLGVPAGLAPPASPGTTGAAGSHPAGPGVLAGGLVLLFLSAFGGRRVKPGRGFGR